MSTTRHGFILQRHLSITEIISGGTASGILQYLALQIQQVTRDNNLTVLYRHIAWVKDTKTDSLGCQ